MVAGSVAVESARVVCYSLALRPPSEESCWSTFQPVPGASGAVVADTHHHFRVPYLTSARAAETPSSFLLRRMYLFSDSFKNATSGWTCAKRRTCERHAAMQHRCGSGRLRSRPHLNAELRG